MIRKDLTPKQRDALPERLKLVWASVFGSVYAPAFNHSADLHGFDHEDDFDHAEYASTVADRAVYQLRKWESENQ